MELTTKRTVAALLLVVWAALPASAQSPGAVAEQLLVDELTKIDLAEGETFETLVDRYLERLEDRQTVAPALDSVAEEEVEDAAVVTGNSPGTVGAPSPFGTRVANSLTSFQSILGLSLDAVNLSDDHKSVTVDFNPLKVGPYGAIKLAAQVTEPTPHSMLIDKVREAQRSAVQDSLSEDFSDFDDILWSVTYGYQTRSDDSDRSQGNLWGRNPRLYQSFARALFAQAWDKAVKEVQKPSHLVNDMALELLGRALEAAEAPQAVRDLAVEKLSPAIIRETVKDASEATRLIDDLRRFLAENLLHSIAIGEVINDAELGALGDLIDNQPTATVTLAYRDTAELIGQQSYSGTVRVDMGSWNVNRVFKEMKKGTSLTDAYAWVVDQKQYLDKDRFTFELSYNHIDALDLSLPYVEMVTDLATGDTSSFDRVAEFTAPEAEEWTGMFQYSRAVVRQTNEIKGAEIHPRFDVSIEYKDASGDPMRTKTRLIAKASYQLPLANGLSLPLALTWANRPEFLGEQDDELSAHLGLSYGLDRLFEKEKKGE